MTFYWKINYSMFGHICVQLSNTVFTPIFIFTNQVNFMVRMISCFPEIGFHHTFPQKTVLVLYNHYCILCYDVVEYLNLVSCHFQSGILCITSSFLFLYCPLQVLVFLALRDHSEFMSWGPSIFSQTFKGGGGHQFFTVYTTPIWYFFLQNCTLTIFSKCWRGGFLNFFHRQ